VGNAGETGQELALVLVFLQFSCPAYEIIFARGFHISHVLFAPTLFSPLITLRPGRQRLQR
jgi:hypothetical protein